MSVTQSVRTMFARHKLGGTKHHIEWLRENHFIAINWDDSPSTDKNKYGDDGRSRAYQEIRPCDGSHKRKRALSSWARTMGIEVPHIRIHFSLDGLIQAPMSTSSTAKKARRPLL